MKSITSLAPEDDDDDVSGEEEGAASVPFSADEDDAALLDFNAARRAVAISCRASCMNPATARRACNSFFMFSSFCRSFLNVEGSMLGKRRSAKGSKNSMKGTMTKIAKGTRRKMSMDVRISCFRSLWLCHSDRS